jgi:hypothetical protein
MAIAVWKYYALILVLVYDSLEGEWGFEEEKRNKGKKNKK